MELKLASAWRERLKLRSEGYKILDYGDKLVAEGECLRADGDRLVAEGEKLRNEGEKIVADGTKLWNGAAIETYGNIGVWTWNTIHGECTLDNGDVYGREYAGDVNE